MALALGMAMTRTRTEPLAHLLGEWQSDRHRTLQYWTFPKNVPARTKKLIRSKKFFGHLRFRITPKRFTVRYEGKSSVQPYRVIFNDAYRIVLAFGTGRQKEIRDLHFDGHDSFYMLAGKANCEFFRRVGASNAFKGRRVKRLRP
jgi:hypothetical protein